MTAKYKTARVARLLLESGKKAKNASEVGLRLIRGCPYEVPIDRIY